MIIWYKNSFLASVVSIIGCIGAALGVADLFQDEMSRELTNLEAAGVIVVGLVLAIVGKAISVGKAKQTAGKNAPVSGRSQQPQGRQPFTVVCAVIAAVMFLASAGVILYCLLGLNNHRDLERIYYLITAGVYLVLGIASVVTAFTKKINLLHTIGFIVFMAIELLLAMGYIELFGNQRYISDSGVHYYMFAAPLIRAIMAFIMTVLSLLSMGSAKLHFGGAVRALWFIPMIALVLGNAKDFTDVSADWYFAAIILDGVSFPTRPELLHILICGASLICSTLAFIMTGLCCARICRHALRAGTQTAGVDPDEYDADEEYAAPRHQYEPRPQYAEPRPQYTEPRPQYAEPKPQYTEPRQQYTEPRPQYTEPKPQYAEPKPQYTEPRPQYTEPRPQYTEPKPQYTAPVANAASDAEVQKKLQACRDLLDIGVLSQEEYDAEVSKILRG